MADETTTDPAERIRQLEADLAAERERATGYESTLKTLEGQRRQPSPGPRGSLSRLSRDEAQDLADELGWTVEQVNQHYPVIEAMFRRVATPVLSGLNGLVDHVDHIDARTDLSDWKDIEAQVDKVRKEHVARGEFITRKKAAALVKAERLQDPAYLDKLAEERAAKKAAAEADREGERTAATTEGTRPASQTAGPGPTKGPRAQIDREAFDAMPLEDKRKHLNESGVAF